MEGLMLTARSISPLARKRNALVSPQPGHGIPVNTSMGQNAPNIQCITRYKIPKTTSAQQEALRSAIILRRIFLIFFIWKASGMFKALKQPLNIFDFSDYH